AQVERESLEARLDRAADAVTAVVEHEPDRIAMRVVRVLLVDVGARWDRVAGNDEPADLRGEDEVARGLVAQGRAHPSFGGAQAVQRSHVERPDTEVPRPLHGRGRVLIADRGEQAADRCAPEA